MLAQLAPILLIAAAAGGVAYALLFPLLSGQKRAEDRIKAYVPVTVQRVARAPQSRSKRDQVAQSLKEVEAREKARGKLTLEDRIMQAGLTIDRRTFYLYSGLSAAAFAFAGNLAMGGLIGPIVGALVGGLGAPGWWLAQLRKRRMAAFLNEFPNALDVITRGLKSGLPLNDCVRIISAEAAEPVRSEFKAMMDAQAIGLSLGEAIDELYRRIPLPEAGYFSIIIGIQAKAGGNLAESLGNMSKVVRERRKLKGKIKALSAEAITSAGIIACMPLAVMGLVYISTPDYIRVLWITQAGQFILVGCAVWMTMGCLIMRKMINFDF